MKLKISDFSNGINAKIDQNVLPLNVAKTSYNFDFFSMGLKNAMRFHALKCPLLTLETSLDKLLDLKNMCQNGRVHFYKRYDFTNNSWDDKLIIFDQNLNCFYLNLCTDEAVLTSLGIEFSSFPSMVNYRLNGEDVVIFASPTDNMYVWNGVDQPQEIIDAPKIKSMVIHNERLFATTVSDQSELWFSDDLDPTNWSVSLNDAGVIAMVDELRGSLNKVVSFGDYLFVFRENGISKLSASAGQESFYLTHLFVTSGKIFENTVEVAGDRIIFVASDGIFCFDGINTKSILDNLKDKIMIDDNCKAKFFNGKYYLSCKVNFEDNNVTDLNYPTLNGDGTEINAILSIDVKSGEYVILRGVSVVDMEVVNTNYMQEIIFLNKSDFPLLTLNNTENPTIVQNMVWRSGLSDIDNTIRIKAVRHIYLSVFEGSATFKLFNENGDCVSYNLCAGLNDIPTYFIGRRIGYEISSASNNVCVSNLVLEIV